MASHLHTMHLHTMHLHRLNASDTSVAFQVFEAESGEWDTVKYPWLKSMSFSYTVDKCPDTAAAACHAMEGPAGSAQAYTSSSWNSVSGVATLRWETADKTRATMPARESAVIHHPPSHAPPLAVSVSALLTRPCFLLGDAHCCSSRMDS